MKNEKIEWLKESGFLDFLDTLSKAKDFEQFKEFLQKELFKRHQKIKEESEWLKDLFREIETEKAEYYQRWGRNPKLIAFNSEIYTRIEIESPQLLRNNAKICALNVFRDSFPYLERKFILE